MLMFFFFSFHFWISGSVWKLKMLRFLICLTFWTFASSEIMSETIMIICEMYEDEDEHEHEHEHEFSN